ncbi:MAG: DUF5687 family protein [Bacteroidota bacterium]
MRGPLLRHHLKSILRAPIWSGKQLLTNLLVGLFVLYLLANLTVVGLLFDYVIEESMPGTDPQALLNRALLPVFLVLLVVRYLLQASPELRLRPYLHLPLSRPRLAHYAQLTSLTSTQNLYPLFFFLPYAGANLLPSYGPVATGSWLVGVLLVLLISHYTVVLLRMYVGVRLGRFALVLAAGTLLFVADRFVGGQWLPAFSEATFSGLLTQPALALIVLGLGVAGLYGAAYRLTLQRLYPETDRGLPAPTAPRFQALERLGLEGALISNELRLITRNRRPRQMVLSSVLLFALGLYMMLASASAEVSFNLAIWAFLISAAGFLNYGQFMFSWEGAHFDALLSRAIPPERLIRSKLYLLCATCVLFGGIAVPVVLLVEPSYLNVLLAMAVYNAGLTVPLVLLMATFNNKAVQLGGSSLLNYQGTGLHHFVWILPIMLIPTIVLAMLGLSGLALLGLAAFGLVSLLAYPMWTRFLAQRLRARRHLMAASFRSS